MIDQTQEIFTDQWYFTNSGGLNNTLLQIAEQNTQAIAVIGVDRRIIWINKAAENWYGFTLQEAVGQIASELLKAGSTDANMLTAAITAITKKEYYQGEFLVHKKQGTPIWVRLTIQPLLDEAGEASMFCLYNDDISAYKKAQEIFEQGKARYKTILNSIADIIFEANEKGEFLVLNNAWENILGYPVAESIGTSVFKYLHPDDKDRIEGVMYLMSIEKKAVKHVEFRLLNATGEIVWFETTNSLVISNETGDVIGYTGILKDITYVKELKHHHEILSNNIGDMVTLHELDGSYIYISPSMKDITGHIPEELLGKSAYSYFHPDDLARIADNHHRYLETGDLKYESITFRYMKSDGTYTWLESKTKQFYDNYVGRNRLVVSSKPADAKIKEEESLKAELQNEKKLHQLKSSFVSFVSHEFRTPLAIIKSVTELLQLRVEHKEPQLESAIMESITNIDTEVEGLTNLIDDVLILEKVSSGDVALQKQPLDLVQHIRHCAKRLVLKQADGRTAIIDVRGSKEKLWGDPKYIDLIFTNLLSNAFKYSVGKPSPMVIIKFEAETVRVSIIDFGIGIPYTDQRKMFSSFYRASNVNNIEGTGLGLSIVKKFIEMHAGSISYNSIPDECTEFIVTLPYNSESVS